MTWPRLAERRASLPICRAATRRFIDDYVVDGHVPVEAIDKLRTERPPIKGITLPGMPEGSPGMYGKKTEPFAIYAIGRDGAPSVFIVV